MALLLCLALLLQFTHLRDARSLGLGGSLRSNGAASRSLTQRLGAPTASSVAVVGERHSGTAYMERLLRARLPDLNLTRLCGRDKHAYQFHGADCPPLESTIVVVMLRNPYDWALAMHKTCWCGGSSHAEAVSEGLAGLPFDTFVSVPWTDYSLAPGQGDPRVVTANVMRYRAAKHLNLLNITSWAPNVEYVHHEAVLSPRQAKRWLAGFIERHGLQYIAVQDDDGAGPDRPAFRVRMAEAKARMAKSVWFNRTLTKQDPELRSMVRAVNQAMDLAVESMAGYRPLHEPQ